jgi:hypothetical protein
MLNLGASAFGHKNVGRFDVPANVTKRSKKAWMEWRRLVSEQARSGQTVISFFRERGFRRPYFFVWKKRLEESAAAHFPEVQVSERAASGDASVEIRVKYGRSLMARPGFDAFFFAAHVRRFAGHPDPRSSRAIHGLRTRQPYHSAASAKASNART